MPATSNASLKDDELPCNGPRNRC